MKSFTILTAAMVVLSCALNVSAADGQPPNILFIFSDDHASHAISAYDSKINETPHIDRIAAEGMLFRNAFCTNGICGPSRAVILTGKHSHLNGFMRNGDTFDGGQQTFPKLLQKAGYQTAVIGKWHLASEPTGFDLWRVLPGQGDYYNPDYRTPDGMKRIEGYSVEITTDTAMDWMENQRDKSKPFMLMCQYKAPHRNWMPGPDYLTKYDGQDIPEPPTLFDDYTGRGTAARQQEMTIARHMYPTLDLKLDPREHAGKPEWSTKYLDRLTPEQRERWHAAYGPKNQAFYEANLKGDDLLRWKYQRYIKDYLRCVAAVDDNIGRLLDYLDESGLADNTVVIYSSDQGWYLGDHGWYDKRWMYEESLRMPLVVRWPGKITAGSVDTHLVQNLDFASTFLEMAGIEVPADMQGRSLVPILKGQSPQDWRQSIYYHYYEYPAVHMVHKHYGVRTDRYKLINFYELGEWELYDLLTDPDELQSVYGEPAYAAITARLKHELERLREHYQVIPEDEARRRVSLRSLKDVPLQQVVALSDAKADPPRRLDPSNKPLVIGAWCIPSGADGVLIAQGGEGLGYSLYLKDGRPHFAIRNAGVLVEAIADESIDPGTPVHLIGLLTNRGQQEIYINGSRVASVAGHVISSRPGDGLSIGMDTGSFVGQYNHPMPFQGDLRDIRIYWGTLDDTALEQWAAR